METDYSPIIISHPYFNSGIMPNEKGEFINILEDEVEYDKAINRVKKAIMERKDAFSILAMVNKPYMLVFVYLVFNYLSDEDKGLLLRYAWISSEFPNADVNVSRDELRSMFKACKPECLMEGVDLAFYKDMPWRFTVYRGTKKENDYDALSWTLDYEKAEWFANRFGTKGKVISKKVKRKDVLAFFNDEDESEIIIWWLFFI